MLEFRAGGGESEAPRLKFDETSLEAIQRIIDVAYDNDSLWEAPERMGDTAFREAAVEAESQASAEPCK